MRLEVEVKGKMAKIVNVRRVRAGSSARNTIFVRSR